jgi:[NiFe] hydrogenase assembly HybE family chaperone
MDAGQCDEAAAIEARIERCFHRIETQRMAGIPILNRALRVEVVGLGRFGDEWLCILVTPWFMNVMLLPAAVDDGAATGTASPGAVGGKELVAFPAGRFEMIRGYEADIGSYRMCSLFSPMLEFADHDSAVVAATAALAALTEADAVADSDAEMAMIWRGERPPRRASDTPAEADEVPAPPQAVARTDNAVPAIALSRRGLLLGRLRAEESK